MSGRECVMASHAAGRVAAKRGTVSTLRGCVQVMPKQRGFEARRDLYLVYHYLNHYNLFGSSYYSESERLLQKLQRAVS